MSIDLPDSHIESIMLNKMMNDPSHLALYTEYYEPRWFLNNSIQKITEVIVKYNEKFSGVPSKNTLNRIFEKQAETKPDIDVGSISRTLDTAMNQNMGEMTPEFVNENIIRFIKDRVIYFTIADNMRNIQENKDLSQCIPIFEKIHAISFDTDLGMSYFEEWERHEEYITSDEVKLLTGWDNLDAVTYGGFPSAGKCLIVPIAQAGLGKSMFLSNLAVNVMKESKNVLVISLEMSEDIYASRFHAHISTTDINMMKFNVGDIKESVSAFKTKYGSDLYIKEYPPSSINCNHLKNYIDKLNNKLVSEGKSKIDMILVDYISLMNSIAGDSDSMYTRVGNIAKELRALSYYFGVPVVAPQQINGDAIDSTQISMANMSESKAINHHADFIGALCQQEGDKQAGIMRMIILKNRFGGQIGMMLQWAIDYQNLLITNWDDTINMNPLTVDEVSTTSVLDDLNNLE